MYNHLSSCSKVFFKDHDIIRIGNMVNQIVLVVSEQTVDNSCYRKATSTTMNK